MEYKKIDQTDLSFLRNLLGSDRVYVGHDISDDYSHDELGGISKMPDVMVEVLSVNSVLGGVQDRQQEHGGPLALYQCWPRPSL